MQLLPAFMFIMTALTTSSCSSIVAKTVKQLPADSNRAYQHLREIQPRMSGQHEQHSQDLMHRKVKYSTLERDETKESRIRMKREVQRYNRTSGSRTFGLRRPFKFAIPSIMFKLGIITTMLAVLTLLSAKSLVVGLIILVIQLSTNFAKYVALKKKHEEEEVHEPQNIHVHVHGSAQHGYYKSSYPHKPYSSHSPYSSYGPYSEISKSDVFAASRIDEDYYQRLNELRELDRLRDSLYTQVI